MKFRKSAQQGVHFKRRQCCILCRSWLAVELLCFCEEQGLQQHAVALSSYLAGIEQSEGSPAVSSDPLLEETLMRCAHCPSATLLGAHANFLERRQSQKIRERYAEETLWAVLASRPF